MENIKNKRDMFAYTFATYQRFCKNRSCTCCPMMESRGVCAIETDAETAATLLEDWDNNNPAYEYCKQMDIDKTNLLFITTKNIKSIIGCRKVVMERKASPPNCAFNPYTSDECWECWNKAYNA